MMCLIWGRGTGANSSWGKILAFEIKPDVVKLIKFRVKRRQTNMKEIRKEDIKQGVFDLYDDYAHNRIERRDFMQKLSTYAVGGLTVASLMSFSCPITKPQSRLKPMILA
jgi:hypothetical protein